MWYSPGLQPGDEAVKTLATGLLCLVATAALAQEAEAPGATPPPIPVVQLGDSTRAVCTAFYIGTAGTPLFRTSTGARLSTGFLVSAGHCVFETGIGQADFRVLPVGSDRKIHGPGGLLAASFVAGGNVDLGLDDWALFRLISEVPKDWKPAVLDCAYVPKVGDLLTAVGFPAANSGLTTMQGFVNGTPRPVDGMFPVIPVTMAVSGGASGSPVFEADGRVVGIVVAVNLDQPAWSYVQPLGSVCQALHIKA